MYQTSKHRHFRILLQRAHACLNPFVHVVIRGILVRIGIWGEARDYEVGRFDSYALVLMEEGRQTSAREWAFSTYDADWLSFR